jgi:hypothetical protein
VGAAGCLESEREQRGLRRNLDQLRKCVPLEASAHDPEPRLEHDARAAFECPDRSGGTVHVNALGPVPIITRKRDDQASLDLPRLLESTVLLTEGEGESSRPGAHPSCAIRIPDRRREARAALGLVARQHPVDPWLEGCRNLFGIQWLGADHSAHHERKHDQ